VHVYDVSRAKALGDVKTLKSVRAGTKIEVKKLS